MKRLLVLALLGFLAGRADAQLIKIYSDPGHHRPKCGHEPPPLGPWYNYWPLEAHFQVPAMPEYPYFPAPQTLPVVPPAPYGAKPLNSNMPAANGLGGMYPYGGFNGYGGYPGLMPNANSNSNAPGMMPSAGSNQPQAQQQPAAYPFQNAMSGYPAWGYGYPNYGFGYPQTQQRPFVALPPGNAPRQ